MKLTRPRTLGTLAIAGTFVGATLVLAAPQASARAMDGFAGVCWAAHGQTGLATHYDFDVYGNVASQTQVQTCHMGGQVIWNDVDVFGNPYG
jgi:hypothetical protein